MASADNDELPVPQVSSRAPELRISDAEREQAVALLRRHCGEGRLTLDEFSDRVGVVFAARTAREIERVLVDLPVLDGPALRAEASASLEAPRTTRTRRAVKWTVSVFGGNQQRGRWRIEGETNAVSFMGGCHLDLREAEVKGAEAVINAFAFMGGIDVIVPEGIEVVLEGFAFMGGRHAKVKDVPIIPGSPVIRVRAFAFMGGVSVRSKGPSTRGQRGVGTGGSGGSSTAARRAERHLERAQRHLERDLRHQQREASRAGRRGEVGPGAGAGAGAGGNVGGSNKARGIDAVAADVREDWPAVRAQVAPEGTVTIMFSDIEGFTAMCDRLGDHRANDILREHYRLVRDELARHAGFEVKVHGDGFMVAFSSASRALRCAQAIQRAQREWNDEHPENPVHVRMGLHTGEAIRDADDFLGTTVNLASRIADAANGDEILVSGLLRELCVSSGEFEFDGGDEVALKGISQPHRVYSVRYD
jgi:class 3 adenylate cyclase